MADDEGWNVQGKGQVEDNGEPVSIHAVAAQIMRNQIAIMRFLANQSDLFELNNMLVTQIRASEALAPLSENSTRK